MTPPSAATMADADERLVPRGVWLVAGLAFAVLAAAGGGYG
ncbi:MAG: hypothetical protein ACXV0U_10295 [Kineosporiaceae bacterium]